MPPAHRAPSPEASAVLRHRRRHRRPCLLSRRAALIGAGAATALVAGGGYTAWRQPWRHQPTDVCRNVDLSGNEKQVVFANWPLYIDVDEKNEKRRPTLEAFTRRTGITVTYREEIEDNEAFLATIWASLASCRPAGRDLVVLTDWAAARLIRAGLVQKLDPERLPNVEANLLPNLRIPSWDPAREHAVPWQSGLTGIAYNGKVTRAVRTVDELFTRPDLKGRVTVLTDMRDTMGLVLQSLGYDPAAFTDNQFEQALQKLAAAVISGQVRGGTGNDYTEGLAKGDIAACMAWSGDVVQLRFDDEKIHFVAPESGVVLWSDNMLVPNGAGHLGNSLQLIDHYYEPAVAAEVAAYVNYICPVAGAHVEMEKIDPKLATNPLIFPEPEVLAGARIFMALDDEQERIYEQKFRQAIKAGR